MRFSIWPSPAQPWDDIYEITAHCEQTGWDGVYFADHFMPNGPGPAPLDGDTLECWSVMAALAALVPRIRLASLVTSVTYRHPAVLAKIAAAVDHISHGRLTLGVGAGWQENEHASYGLPLGTVRERMDRFEEAVQVRRTMRIAARYADQWNAWTTPDLLTHKVSVLRAHCEQAGRDPGEIHVSTQALLYLSTSEEWLGKRRLAQPGPPVIVGTPAEVAEIVARYRDAGADELIIPDHTLGSMARKKDTCDLFIEQVAPAFR